MWRIHIIVNLIWKYLPADRRAQFETLEYTEDDYQKELEHIEQVRSLGVIGNCAYVMYKHVTCLYVWYLIYKMILVSDA